MKIAILSPVAWRTPPRHYGPWEQMASNLTEGLLQKGIDATLFATADSITAGTLKAICPAGYEEDRSLDAKVQECLHISHLMEQAATFDILHNHFDFLPLTWSRLVPTPMVTTIHGFSSEKIIPVYEKYNDIGHYVSISQADRSPRLSYAATIYNGIHSEDFPFCAQSADYLLFFGRIHPHKGAHDAIRIARATGHRLLMAGIIQDRDYFDTAIAPYIDDDQVSYIGPVGGVDRSRILGQAKALLHPIHFDEPFGLSVAEAMHCGTPVIAYHRGSMPELILHGHTGFLATDTDAAIQAVKQLPDIRREDCHHHAATHFSQEKMVADYIRLYERLLS